MPLHRISPDDHCRLVAKAGKTRNQSTKFPCGECNLECKDGSLYSFKCGTWFHANFCSGVATNMLASILKLPGLIWLCKNCVDDGKRCLKEGSETLRLPPEIGKKLKDIQAKLVDSKKTSANLSAMLEKEIESKVELFESNFESKMNAVLDN